MPLRGPVLLSALPGADGGRVVQRRQAEWSGGGRRLRRHLPWLWPRQEVQLQRRLSERADVHWEHLHGAEEAGGGRQRPGGHSAGGGQAEQQQQRRGQLWEGAEQGMVGDRTKGHTASLPFRVALSTSNPCSSEHSPASQSPPPVCPPSALAPCRPPTLTAAAGAPAGVIQARSAPPALATFTLPQLSAPASANRVSQGAPRVSLAGDLAPLRVNRSRKALPAMMPVQANRALAGRCCRLLQ